MNVKKVVHASTGSVLGGRPKSFYGTSKLAGEAYLRNFGEYYSNFRYSILQYYHIYGTRQDNSDVGGVIPIFIRNILNDDPVTIFGDGLQVRHFTNVSDVVDVNFLAANNGIMDGKTYRVVSDIRITILDLAKLLFKLMKKEVVDINFAPPKLGDIKQFNINNNKLKAIGFEFQNDFENCLLETISWCKTLEEIY